MWLNDIVQSSFPSFVWVCMCVHISRWFHTSYRSLSLSRSHLWNQPACGNPSPATPTSGLAFSCESWPLVGTRDCFQVSQTGRENPYSSFFRHDFHECNCGMEIPSFIENVKLSSSASTLMVSVHSWEDISAWNWQAQSHYFELHHFSSSKVFYQSLHEWFMLFLGLFFVFIFHYMEVQFPLETSKTTQIMHFCL